jgi:hypothetical protein
MKQTVGAFRPHARGRYRSDLPRPVKVPVKPDLL